MSEADRVIVQGCRLCGRHEIPARPARQIIIDWVGCLCPRMPCDYRAEK